MSTAVGVAKGRPPAGRRTLPAIWVRLGRAGLALAGIVVLAAGWQLISNSLDTPILPTFTVSIRRVWELLKDADFRSDIGVSLVRVLLGFAISGVVGTVLGLALGMRPRLAAYCTAVLDFCRSVPVPLLVPVFIVALGLGNKMVVAMIVTGAVWPVLLNAFRAARGIDPTALESARSCGIRGFALFRLIVLPACVPQIFAGLRVALSTSIAVMVVAEILGADVGIGHFIQSAQQSFRIPDTYAGVIVLGCIGWLADSLFLLSERWLLGWHHAMLRRGRSNG